MTRNEMLTASKRLSKTDLCFESNGILFETYWCRVASGKSETWNHELHAHSFFEVHLALEGECEFDIGVKRELLTKGRYFVLPIKQRHRTVRVSEDFAEFVWGFSARSDDEKGAIISKFAENFKLKDTNKYLTDALDAILYNVLEYPRDSYDVIKSYLYCIFITLLRADINASIVSEENRLRYSEKFELIKKYIYENASFSLTTSDIAKYFNMSERHLSRISMAHCNMPIGKLKQSIQIDIVKTLLKNTDKSLKEIACESGFCDEYTMGKAFKRVEGMPPGHFRSGLKK